MPGIGIDIVAVARVRRLRALHPERFPARVLHADEMPDYRKSRNKDAFLARRFAAKEAVGKALGRGFSGLPASAICIGHGRLGRPEVLAPAAACGVLVSIADETEYATATALCPGKAQ